MAGVPPMVGFFAKYHVLYVAMLNGHYAIALLGVVTSVISAAYYLRVVRVLYFDPVMTGTVPQSTGLTSQGVQATGHAS